MHYYLTRNRDSIITKSFLKKRPQIHVHKGKSFSEVILSKRKIGHRLGEFSLTKKLGAKIHNSKKNKKKREKNKQKK